MLDEKPPPLVAAGALIEFTEGDQFPLDTPFEQIVHGTFMRSRDTFKAIHNLLATGFPVQAAMLVRSLFEDMVVAHWLVLNRDDPDWLIGRFHRHRDAMALHQDRLRRETRGWGMGRPLADPKPLRLQQNALFKEFGGEAQRDWWDPCANGDGTGEPLGLRGVAVQLEQAAADGGLGWLRFAGGQEPLLARTELVVHKWMTQFLHHTALGLPFGLSEEGDLKVLNDPSDMVMMSAYWTFGQQIYLLHEVHGRDIGLFEGIFIGHLVSGFGHLGGSPDEIVQVSEEARPRVSGTTGEN